MDGEHPIEVTVKITEHVLAEVYKALHDANILLEGTLLKPNMVIQGSECKTTSSNAQIGHATVTVLSRTVPVAVPGVTVCIFKDESHNFKY